MKATVTNVFTNGTYQSKTIEFNGKTYAVNKTGCNEPNYLEVTTDWGSTKVVKSQRVIKALIGAFYDL